MDEFKYEHITLPERINVLTNRLRDLEGSRYLASLDLALATVTKDETAIASVQGALDIIEQQIFVVRTMVDEHEQALIDQANSLDDDPIEDQETDGEAQESDDE